MNKSSNNYRGMTLIEILVALAIVAFVATIAFPTVSNIMGENIKSTARKLAGTIKYLYNNAIIKNKVIRLVYDFKTNSYWAEFADSNFLIDKNKEEDEEKEESEDFEKVDEKFLKPISLDRGVKFKSIFSVFRSEMISKNRAYTHFFPGGFAESSIIHIQSDNDVYSIVVEPMLGVAKVYDYFIDPDFMEE